MRVHGCCKQEVAALRWKREQAIVDEIVESLRYGQRLARIDGNARAAKRADDLQRVERVSSRNLVHFGRKRTRKRDAEVLVDDTLESDDIEWPYVDLREAIPEGSP
jgi:hypothetical protein